MRLFGKELELKSTVVQQGFEDVLRKLQCLCESRAIEPYSVEMAVQIFDKQRA